MRKLIWIMAFLLGWHLESDASPAFTKNKMLEQQEVKSAKTIEKENRKAANSEARTKAKIEAKNNAVKTKSDGTPDRRYKENKKLKADGTPDKRYKENKGK